MRFQLPVGTSDRLRMIFYSQVDRRTGCWDWIAGIDDEGYGRARSHDMAHRVSYRAFVGPIPRGLSIDHLCSNRRCVNPAHLEAVTISENLARAPMSPANVNRMKTHCIHGHAFDGENTRVERHRSGCGHATTTHTRGLATLGQCIDEVRVQLEQKRADYQQTKEG